jgi:predicted ATP-grasp superfamily ATP-dependent carboligase
MKAVNILPPAFVLGLSPTGLYAIREFGVEGIPVIGVATERQAGSASRYLQDVILEPDEDRRVEELIHRAGREHRKPILIPTSDQDLEFIIRHRQRLAGSFVFQESYRDGVAARILTKADFYRLCAEHGVDYPSLYEIEKPDMPSLAGSLDFPVLIKPSRIHEIKSEMAGQKGWVAQNAADYARMMELIPDHAGTLLVQEIVPGPESEITLFAGYFDEKGCAHHSFTCRKLRQFPPGFGSASLVISEDEPETREIAEKFLREIGFRGIAAAEFKRDPRTGKRKIIEINPRPSLWFSASTAAGKSVALAAYRDLTGVGPLPEGREQRNGVVWRYALKDFYSATFYRLKNDFVLPPPNIAAARHASKRVSAVGVPGDRAPAWAELKSYLRKGLRRLLPRKHNN